VAGNNAYGDFNKIERNERLVDASHGNEDAAAVMDADSRAESSPAR
jgi:hypothetical protein